MLDTNIVSHAIRGNEKVLSRLTEEPPQRFCISSITAGELLFGIAKRPQAVNLAKAVNELLLRLEILAWDEFVCPVYGTLRADLELGGKSLASLDTLIAAHALCSESVLVTNDQAFKNVPGLQVEDWLGD